MNPKGNSEWDPSLQRLFGFPVNFLGNPKKHIGNKLPLAVLGIPMNPMNPNELNAGLHDGGEAEGLQVDDGRELIEVVPILERRTHRFHRHVSCR